MRRLLILASGVALAAAALSGVGPPARAADPPGAECVDCHAEIVEHFATTPHGRLVDGDWFGTAAACASCHGPADEHLETMEASAIRNFPGEDPTADSNVCLSCHTSRDGLGSWHVGEHATAGMSCTDCHNPHFGWEEATRDARLGARQEQDLYRGCYECHTEVRAQVRMPSRHPIAEGKMDCGSCHNPHGAEPGMLATTGRLNDLCFSCHPAQQGPFVFQHAPVEEDCSYCHAPHGAVANNLLHQTEPFLCLQCHEPHFHAALESPEETEVTFGSIPPNTWDNPFGHTGMKRAFLTKCTQCHSQVHGTDHYSAGVSGGGGALQR